MADISCFATKDMAEDGVIIPVKIDGYKLPMAIKIYGSDSDKVKMYERERIRMIATKQNKKNKDIDDELIDEVIDSREEGVIIRIGGVYSYDWKKKKTVDEPVILNDKEITNDYEGYSYLLEKLPALSDWVTEQSNDRNNFLLAGKKN